MKRIKQPFAGYNREWNNARKSVSSVKSVDKKIRIRADSCSSVGEKKN